MHLAAMYGQVSILHTLATTYDVDPQIPCYVSVYHYIILSINKTIAFRMVICLFTLLLVMGMKNLLKY